MKLKTNKIILTMLLLAGFYSVNAQTDNSIGSWDVFVLKGYVNNNIFYHSEFNMRQNSFASTYNYGEYKFTLGYMFEQNFGIGVGAGEYESSLTGSFLTTQPSQKELRVWIDFLFRNSYKRFAYENRFRIEHRYNTSGTPNRIRYRPVFTASISKPRLTDNTLFFISTNDAFFGPNHPTFELNMLYLGLGYKMDRNFTFCAGNMNLYDFTKKSNRSSNYLYLMLVCELTSRSHDRPL